MSKVTAVKILKENFYNRIDKHDEVQFLDSSTLNHALCLEIAESTFANTPISYEYLCHQIPRKLDQDPQFLIHLIQAVEKGYFIKESIDFDKRIKNYKLSSNFQKVIIDWIEELKAATSNL